MSGDARQNREMADAPSNDVRERRSTDDGGGDDGAAGGPELACRSGAANETEHEEGQRNSYKDRAAEYSREDEGRRGKAEAKTRNDEYHARIHNEMMNTKDAADGSGSENSSASKRRRLADCDDDAEPDEPDEPDGKGAELDPLGR